MEKRAERFILPAVFGEKRRLAAVIFFLVAEVGIGWAFARLVPGKYAPFPSPLPMLALMLLVYLLVIRVIRWFQRRNWYRKISDGGEKRIRSKEAKK